LHHNLIPCREKPATLYFEEYPKSEPSWIKVKMSKRRYRQFYSSSQNQFYSQINESFRTIKSMRVPEPDFMIRNSIDYSEHETQRSNFDFWDQLKY